MYYRHECLALASQRSLISFIVLDIEPIRAGNSSKSGSATPAGGAGGGGGGYGQGGGPGGGGGSGRYQLAEAQIARVSDFGKNDTVFYVRTHLGNILHPGGVRVGCGGGGVCTVCVWVGGGCLSRVPKNGGGLRRRVCGFVAVWRGDAAWRGEGAKDCCCRAHVGAILLRVVVVTASMGKRGETGAGGEG